MRKRWQQYSGGAKAIVVLAALFLMQIGMCAITPRAIPWYRRVFHVVASNDPFEALGYMAFEAMLCIATLAAIVFVGLVTAANARNRKKRLSGEHE